MPLENTFNRTRVLNVISSSMVLIALLGIIVFFGIMNQHFFAPNNFISIGQTLSVVGVICIGQSLCLLTGGFDLSVGYLCSFVGMVLAWLTKFTDTPYPVGVVFVLAIGLGCGTVHGLVITKLKVNAFITTLGFMTVYQGLVYIVSGGSHVLLNNAAFSFIGTKRVGGLPISIIILLTLFVVFFLVLRFTVFGRRVYCVGGNPKAARVSGINVDRITMNAYMLSGLMAAVAGIILTSRMGAAQITAGATYALDSVAGCILGGILLTGGKGNILYSLAGMAIIVILQNGLIMIQLPSYYQYVATGAVLIFAVTLQNLKAIRQKL